MEGIVFDPAVLESPIAILCGVAILVIAVAAILLGALSDAEAGGRRVYWAEWPLPESGPESPSREEKREDRKVSRAA